MGKLARLGIVAGVVAILLVAVIGAYALAGIGNSNDRPQWSGFPLVRPVLAQSDPLGIIQAEAGLSAYVKIEEANWTKGDLVNLAETLFPTGMKAVGDNFVLGRVVVTTLGRSEEPDTDKPAIETFLYADADGWLLAYMLNKKVVDDVVLSRDGAEALTLTNGCKVLTGKAPDPPIQNTDFGSGLTALECALGAAATILGTSSPEGEISKANWYHWEFTDATDLLIAEVGTRGGGNVNMFVAVPVGAEWRDASMRCIWFNNHGHQSGETRFDDGDPKCSFAPGNTPLKTKDVSLENPFPTAGDLHTVNLQMTGTSSSNAFLEAGVAFIYKSAP